MPPANVLAEVSEQDAIRMFSNLPHSIAGIVANMSFWQSWFIKRCRGESEPMAASATLGWPTVAPGTWTEVCERFLAGLEEAAAFAGRAELLERRIDPAIEFPPLADYTVSDALTHVASHNSHHLGQIIVVRQLRGSWPPPSGSWTW